MKLQKLFEMQAKLDAYVTTYHPVQEGENRLEKKVLALLVELGECAQEWRGFKFWSNDQEPRTEQTCESCDGKGYKRRFNLSNGERRKVKCSKCEGAGTAGNPLLEEYADCLHFLLSIGNDLVITCDVVDFEDRKGRGVTDIFNHLFQEIVHMEYFGLFGDKDMEFKEVFSLFLTLGYKLGFTEEQIEQAYYDKNKVNFERQEQGY